MLLAVYSTTEVRVGEFDTETKAWYDKLIADKDYRVSIYINQDNNTIKAIILLPPDLSYYYYYKPIFPQNPNFNKESIEFDCEEYMVKNFLNKSQRTDPIFIGGAKITIKGYNESQIDELTILSYVNKQSYILTDLNCEATRIK